MVRQGALARGRTKSETRPSSWIPPTTSSCAAGAPSASSPAPRCPRTWSSAPRRSATTRSRSRDRDGVYGAPRFFQAARTARACARSSAREVPVAGAGRALAAGREPRRLPEPLPAAHRARARSAAKGEAAAAWDQVEEHAGGLLCLAGGATGRSPASARPRTSTACAASSATRLAVDVHRHRERAGERLRALAVGARRGARRARRRHQRRAPRRAGDRRAARRPHLHPPRHHARPRRAAPRSANAERHLDARAPRWRRCFADLPGAVRETPPHRRALRLHARRPGLPLPRLSRCRRARRRSAICARSPATARASATATDHAARPRASSSTSSPSSRSSTSPATS